MMKRQWLFPLSGAAVTIALTGCAGPLQSALPSDAPRAAIEAASACDDSNMGGCYRLALFYWESPVGTRNPDVAVPLLASACAGGVADACTVSQEVRLGTAGDESLRSAAQRCDRFDQVACVEVAGAWRDGRGLPVDVAHAVTLFAGACEAGIPAGCQGTEQNRLAGRAPETVVRIAAACDNGEGAACKRLGDLYQAGTEVPGDVDAAIRTYRAACLRGDFATCTTLGGQLLDGRTYPRNADMAVEVLRHGCENGQSGACGVSQELALGPAASPELLAAGRACDRGQAEGCNTLGVAWRDGQTGSAADARRASTLFERACDGGLPAGCMNLGLARAAGDGASRDAVAAARLFEEACSAGQMEACNELGTAYRAGLGVPRNLEMAFRYWQQACDGGMQSACDAMPGRVEASMPVDSPDPLRNLARQCDQGTLLSCVELAQAWVNGVGVPRDYEYGNQIVLHACYAGLEAACGQSRFPGPCTVQELDGAGVLAGSTTRTYDRAELRRTVLTGPTSRTVDGLVYVPTVPEGAEIPELDTRASLVWSRANRANFFPGDHQVAVDESRRITDVTTPDGIRVTLAFDASERLQTLTEFRGSTSTESTFRYDARGTLQEVARRVGTGDAATSRFALDANRRITEVRTSANSAGVMDETVRSLTYDNRGLLTEMLVRTQTARSGQTPLVMTRQIRVLRDPAGNIVRRDVRDESRNVLSATTYSYECFAQP